MGKYALKQHRLRDDYTDKEGFVDAAAMWEDLKPTDYHARKITKPANAQEGIVNFVQMIINQLEAGDTREALLTAIDLRQDLAGQTYKIEMQERGPAAVDASGVNVR